MKEIDKYLSENNKIGIYPTKKKKQIVVLNYLISKFEFNRLYTEKEVNELIQENINFTDFILIRRELVDHHLLARMNNGSKYWKDDLIKTIRSERLIIKDSIIEDKQDLIEVNRSCQYLEKYIGEKIEDQYIEQILNGGALPPKGLKEFYVCKSIVVNEKVIGYIELYYGYPDGNTVWISNFYLHKAVQSEGYGTEVIENIMSKLKTYRIKKIALGVHLKNWQALRFWVKNGFKNIIDIYGDKEYDVNHFSIIGLEQSI